MKNKIKSYLSVFKECQHACKLMSREFEDSIDLRNFYEGKAQAYGVAVTAFEDLLESIEKLEKGV